MRLTKPSNRKIVLTSDGVMLRDQFLDETIWAIEWDAIEEIEAFKLDATTVDHLCLGFRVAGAASACVCDEDTSGWRELNEEIYSRFGVEHDEWFASVAFPPFVNKRAVLWRRSTSS